MPVVKRPGDSRTNQHPVLATMSANMALNHDIPGQYPGGMRNVQPIRAGLRFYSNKVTWPDGPIVIQLHSIIHPPRGSGHQLFSDSIFLVTLPGENQYFNGNAIPFTHSPSLRMINVSILFDSVDSFILPGEGRRRGTSLRGGVGLPLNKNSVPQTSLHVFRLNSLLSLRSIESGSTSVAPLELVS